MPYRKFHMAGVMGWPVMHSRSPRLHNHWLKLYGLAGAYVPLAIEPGRVEVWFKPVDAVCLPAVLDGVEILLEHSDRHVVEGVLGGEVRTGQELFVVRSGRSRGWVLAGSVHGRADDMDDDAPPLFDGRAAKPGERELFSWIGHG